MITRLFAQIDPSDIVIAIQAVNESDCLDETGQFSETVGSSFLVEVIGPGEYLETRYDDPSFSRGVARLNGNYDRIRDLFVPPDPEDGSIYDPETNQWIHDDLPIITEE